MAWQMIGSFGIADYPAVRRYRDPNTLTYRFEWSTTRALSSPRKHCENWYVAGWKIHLAIYPADYIGAMRALRLFENRMAPTRLVFKYAASKHQYEGFRGEVKGKFATLYCKSPTDIPILVDLVNLLFTQEGITPVSRLTINSLEGLKHELPLTGGHGFVRYGAFCFTRGILDLTDADRKPMADSRCLAFPRFRNPGRLAAEVDRFSHLIQPLY